tara:strand:+ start:147 stop:533 length:387 start_codon:yes stop_codon:yes gene_type:complete
MLPRLVATISLAALCVLSAMLTITSPADAGPFGLLVVFISAYLTFMGMISFFLFGITRLYRMVLAGRKRARPVRPLPFRKAYYYSTVLAAAPVMLIGLQSVRPLGFYEFALVVIFEIVACVYIGRKMA